MVTRLAEYDHGWRVRPRLYLIGHFIDRRRRIIDSGVGNDCQELVNAWPGNRPWSAPLG